MLRILSLGAGVQSSTIALMIAKGEIPMVDAAIFSDTGWEPKAVYDWLNWLETQLSYPVHRVSAGNIRKDIFAKGTRRVASIPWFTLSADGKKGMGRRQCTKEYKLRPLQRKVVEMHDGKRPKGGTDMLIGISMDEIFRMRPSRVQYINNVFPLIERQMTRQHCLDWMQANGYPMPPKSSCIGCPFHNDAQWRALSKEEMADAIEVDRAIRNQPGMRAQQFMHRKLKPLEEIDFSTPEERGQADLFNNECEGLCGN